MRNAHSALLSMRKLAIWSQLIEEGDYARALT